MTRNAVFFKEYEGIVPNPINGALSEVPRWNGLGSHAPPPSAAAYGCATFVQPKLGPLELSAGGNQLITVAKEPATHFTLFSGDCRSTAENEAKSNLQTVSSVQAPTMDYQGPFKLGIGQPLYPYAEQCYGVYSPYGTHIKGRIMLPLSMASDGGPIFVNVKQYNGIMRRRRSRAKAEMKNKVLKLRKPFLHLSRHLHAKRRPRGNGGRFLNTKNSNISTEKASNPKKTDQKEDMATESQISEVLQSDGGNVNNSKGNSPVSEVTSDHLFARATTTNSTTTTTTTTVHHPFYINHHRHPSFQAFQNMASSGLGIAMAPGSNYQLKV